jgi:two-component system response regulator YesN
MGGACMYKVVIIDDEEWIREGLLKKLQKSGFDFSEVAEAENADEGLKIIRQIKPEIVICDIRMNGMNGLALSETVTQMLPNTKIIIISGYDEFDYAKKALQLGVVDFLLKPINSTDLTNSLEKCIAMIEKKNSELKKLETIATLEQLNETKSRFLKCLNREEGNLKEVFLGYQAGSSFFQCIYLYIGNQEHLNKEIIIKSVFGQLSARQYNPNMVLYENNENEYALVFCINKADNTTSDENLLKDVIAEIAESCRKLGINPYTIGVSDDKPNPGESVTEALNAMKYRVLLRDNSIIYHRDIGEYTHKFRLQTQNVTLIKYNLRNHQYNNLSDILEDIYDEVARYPISYSSIQNLYTNFLLIGLDEFNQNLENKVGFYPREVYWFNCLKDMFEFVKELYRRIIDITDPKDEDYKIKLIYEVKEYIDLNYNKSVTLESIAAMQHINFCYLSMLFKEILKVNFQNYLMSVRINNAKALLNMNRYSIKQVASMTGFADEHYFSKVFKKVEGVPPKEFVKKERNKKA